MSRLNNLVSAPAANGSLNGLAGENLGSLAFRHRIGRYSFDYDVPSSPGTPATPAPAAPVQQAVAAPVAPVVQGFSADQMTALTQSVTAVVTQTVQQAIAPVNTQMTAITQRVEQLAQPQGRVQQLYNGGAPAIRTGENILASRGFQYQRMAGNLLNYQQFGAEQCKLELEFTDDLRNWYQQAGLSHLMSGDRRSILVPLSSTMIPEECHQALSAKWGSIGGLIAQGVRGYDSGRMRSIAQSSGYSDIGRVNQAMSMFDDASMGVFTEAGPHGELITLIRKREALSRLGATAITLPPNGFLPFPKHTGAGTAYWVGETATITPSQVTTGRMEMRARKLAALMTLPNELLRFASVDTEAFLRADMAAVMGLKADLAGLEGTGSTTQPKGILNYSGIVNHTASMTVGTDGNQFEPKTATQMQVELEERDYDPEQDGGAYLMRSKLWGNIVERRTANHTAGTYDGEYLFPVNREDISKGSPAMLRGFPVVKSSQVSNTRTKGSASDLSYVLFGIWKNLLIGRIGVMEFAMSNSGDTNFATDQTSLRCIQYIDYGVRYENSFVLCDKIDMDLPA